MVSQFAFLLLMVTTRIQAPLIIGSRLLLLLLDCWIKWSCGVISCARKWLWPVGVVSLCEHWVKVFREMDGGLYFVKSIFKETAVARK